MRKIFTGLMIATMLMQPVSAFAATESTLPVPFDCLVERTDETTWDGKTLYRIKGTEAPDAEQFEHRMDEFAAKFGSITDAFLVTQLSGKFPIYYFQSKDSNGYYASATINQIEAISGAVDKMNTWIFCNAPKIIPSGTPAKDVPKIIANYLSSKINYDHLAVSNNDFAKRSNYQSMDALVNDTSYGICTTYATAFDTLVAVTPIDNKTNLVDWNTANKSHWHYDVALIQSETHSWSAIKTPNENQWHHYDITWYDGPKDPKYLDMTDEVLHESTDHDITNFYPVDSSLITFWEQ